MYEAFFKLKEKPFNITPSHRFLYLSEGHKEALALLTYGVVERKGFIMLTGDVGTGKTTVIQTLLNNLGTNIECVHFSNPLLSPGEFIDYLASSTFKRRVHFKSKADFLLEFEDYLKDAQQQQRAFILIIDEAQTLSYDLLEEIRLLSNLEAFEEKLINIFLVGQPELIDRLRESRCRALYQRIASRYHLESLNLEETRNYILTRLKVAGAAAPEGIFSKRAVETLYEYSKGIPRNINILADNALLLGYSEGKSKISDKMIEASYRDMHLGEVNPAPTPQPQVEQVSDTPDTEGKVPIKEMKRVSWLRRALWFALALLVLLGVWVYWSGFNVREFIDDRRAGFSRQPIPSTRQSIIPPRKIEKPSGVETGPQSLPPPTDRPVQIEPAEAEPATEDVPGSSEMSVDTVEREAEPLRVVSPRDKPPLLPTTDLIYEKAVEEQSVAQENPEPEAGPSAGERSLIVKRGDILARMAIGVYGRADDDILELIKVHNPEIADIDTIRVGQSIVFPELPPPSREIIFTVHVASYRAIESAQEAFRSLFDAGYDVFIVPFDSSQDELFYRITIRSFQDREEAEMYADKLLKELEFKYAEVIRL